MTRKDTILIAVVINAGLLAILFTTAVIYDTDTGSEQMEFTAPLADNKASAGESPASLIASASTGDEVDNVLKYYSPPVGQPIVVQVLPEVYSPESLDLESHAANDEPSSGQESASFSQDDFVEVKVKKGDMLEKIARVNKTTVGAIKRANNLESERLSIGQVLKIPVKQNSSLYASAAKPTAVESETKQEIRKEPGVAEPVYYVIKSGDNPWKIAKQFGVKYDEILRLNNLDEEKARNLKIGDRVRVK